MRRGIYSAQVALSIGLAGLIWLSVPASAKAVELLMFEARGCPWCERWQHEIGVAYPKTAEGQRATIRVLDIGAARRSGTALAAAITVTPTFVLVDRGREVGRIVGYPGADFFWGLLGELLAKLDKQTEHGGPRAAIARPDRTDVVELSLNDR